MKSHRKPRTMSIALGLALAVGVLGRPASAQRVGGSLFTPVVTVSTAQGSFLIGQAALAVAAGQYQESLARARAVHAEAHATELRNRVVAFDTWLEVKKKNREYRRSLNPDYTTRQARRTLATRRRVVEQADDLVRGDVTRYLNWLLEQIAATEFARFSDEDAPRPSDELNRPLTPQDIGHLLLTDGGRLRGERLTFRADEGRVLETNWPLALRSPEFAADRERFEKVRDEILRHRSGGSELSNEDCQRLQQAMDNLEATFYSYYGYPRTDVGRERRMADYGVYLAGRRYLDALALGVRRVLTTNDSRLFDGGYAFHGDSVRELVRHMCERGCQFAPPEPGDEGTYVKLFYDMRYLYTEILERTDPSEQAAFER